MVVHLANDGWIPQDVGLMQLKIIHLKSGEVTVRSLNEPQKVPSMQGAVIPSTYASKILTAWV